MCVYISYKYIISIDVAVRFSKIYELYKGDKLPSREKLEQIEHDIVFNIFGDNIYLPTLFESLDKHNVVVSRDIMTTLLIILLNNYTISNLTNDKIISKFLELKDKTTNAEWKTFNFA